MKKLLEQFIPPGQWKLPVVILLGIMAGLGAFIFKISNAPSYLSDKPETCINCHVMNPQYASWEHSSHRQVATCNDCHVPHNNVFNKYFFKGKDGLRHATIFTLRTEPQVIRILKPGQKVVQNNCIRCHEKLLEDPQLQTMVRSHYLTDRTSRQCWECHRETPHGRVTSLSAAPNALGSQTPKPVPDWMWKVIEKAKNEKK